jgi:hypothetical protein
VALKSEEALLNRAEAYAVTGQNAKALADINIWTGNFIADSVKYNTYKYDENWNYIYATSSHQQRSHDEVHQRLGEEIRLLSS